ADRQADVSAAAADRLREDAEGVVAERRDRAGVLDQHVARVAAAAAATADTDGEQRRQRLREDLRRECRREAAVSAAAADAGGKDAVGVVAVDFDGAGVADRDVAGFVAGTAEAANRNRAALRILVAAAP